jgi:hypothetical protein
MELRILENMTHEIGANHSTLEAKDERKDLNKISKRDIPYLDILQ